MMRHLLSYCLSSLYFASTHRMEALKLAHCLSKGNAVNTQGLLSWHAFKAHIKRVCETTRFGAAPATKRAKPA